MLNMSTVNFNLDRLDPQRAIYDELRPTENLKRKSKFEKGGEKPNNFDQIGIQHSKIIRMSLSNVWEHNSQMNLAGLRRFQHLQILWLLSSFH